MQVVINSIRFKGSFLNGPGIRTLLFLQGCDICCGNCHNEGAWDINKGEKMEIDELVASIYKECKNKKITITGGEPLYQLLALEELLEKLNDFDICLYTGHDVSEVPDEIILHLRYLKYGKYDERLRCTDRPFIGSTNQKFIRLR